MNIHSFSQKTYILIARVMGGGVKDLCHHFGLNLLRTDFSQSTARNKQVVQMKCPCKNL